MKHLSKGCSGQTGLNKAETKGEKNKEKRRMMPIFFIGLTSKLIRIPFSEAG